MRVNNLSIPGLRIYLSGIGFFILFGIFLYIFIHFYQPILSLSNSVNFKLGYIDKTRTITEDVLKNGVYVYFVYDPLKSDTRPYIKEAVGKFFIKKISCLPGQTLVYNKETREFFCDGRFIAKAKERFLNGEKAVAFDFKGTIPEGKYFVLGDHKDSFDSRYWGFVDIKEIIGIVKPMF